MVNKKEYVVDHMLHALKAALVKLPRDAEGRISADADEITDAMKEAFSKDISNKEQFVTEQLSEEPDYFFETLDSSSEPMSFDDDLRPDYDQNEPD